MNTKNVFGFLAILFFVFYLCVAVVPRAVGREDIPRRIEKVFMPEKPTTIWFYGYGPDGPTR